MQKLSQKLPFRVIGILALSLLWAGTVSATDHSEFIEGPFNSGPEVTMACLECHEDASTEVMATSHWTWESEQIIDGKKVKRGKINVMNNFCGTVQASEPRCTSCHVGYGWKDDSFDFTDQTKVDCLVCHDTTGTYNKPATAAGNPDPKLDLVKIAQNVGAPARKNCLDCHAFGGGGNNVKHGDIGKALINPTKDVDVHLGTDGQDFTCQECHTTESHDIAGDSLVVSPNNTSKVTCEQCHDSDPHSESMLNKHSAKVACQTCHIPTYAKVDGTKMTWDWSASEKGTKVEKEHGHKVFIPKKGRFTYESNVVPEYRWYNGTADAYTLGDKIDPTKPTALNEPLGSIDDKDAKIMPFKVHRGNQAYDATNKYFVTPKVWGPKGDPTAYWVNYKKIGAEAAWKIAAAAGMKEYGLEFSGNIAFAETETYWSINHMVAEADKALGCLDCHGDDGRLDWKELGYKGDPMDL